MEKTTRASRFRMDDYVGGKFGKWLVLDSSRKAPTDARKYQVLCRCDCGEEKYILAYKLTSGRSASCGCSRVFDAEKVIRKRLLKMQKKRAKERGKEWAISDELFQSLITKDCFYCGCPPRISSAKAYGTSKWHRKTTFAINGIDRIDSSIGYVTENVVTCCKHCNNSKSTRTQKEFYEWVCKVYHHSARAIE